MGIHSHQPPSTEPKTHSKNTIKSLYKALARGNLDTVAQVLASELEWWYHGPPNRHHMMLLLTGKSTRCDCFKFKPRSFATVGGELVIAEGWEEDKEAYWVHVWTVKDGKVAKFREYFNTWLNVIHQTPGEDGKEENIKLWQSEPQQRLNWSLPHLVLTV